MRFLPIFTALTLFFLFCQTPVIALVGNDACWSQISREQVPLLGSNVACGLAFTGNASFLLKFILHTGYRDINLTSCSGHKRAHFQQPFFTLKVSFHRITFH